MAEELMKEEQKEKAEFVLVEQDEKHEETENAKTVLNKDETELKEEEKKTESAEETETIKQEEKSDAEEETDVEEEKDMKKNSEEKSPRRKKKKKSVLEYFQFGPDEDFSREDYIITRLPDEDLLEYLRMEQQRDRERAAAKEVRDKRLFKAFELLAVLITIAVIVGFLKDSPLVLVNILYIFGILFAIWTWKNPKDPKDSKKDR